MGKTGLRKSVLTPKTDQSRTRNSATPVSLRSSSRRSSVTNQSINKRIEKNKRRQSLRALNDDGTDQTEEEEDFNSVKDEDEETEEDEEEEESIFDDEIIIKKKKKNTRKIVYCKDSNEDNEDEEDEEEVVETNDDFEDEEDNKKNNKTHSMIGRRKKGRRGRKSAMQKLAESKEKKKNIEPEDEKLDEPIEFIDYTKTQKLIKVTVQNKNYEINTFEPFAIEDLDLNEEFLDTKENLKPTAPKLELPKVNIDVMQDYLGCSDIFKMTPNYIKYVEKSAEELEEEVEYDMDEEDNVWLRLINEKRLSEESIEEQITQEQFELLMDRLEKECYFQTTPVNGIGKGESSSNEAPANTSISNSQKDSSFSNLNLSKTLNDSTNEDALCCICLDGECLNSNVILFCDMCNLAVHQECYGVPYIPEGQWLCRRCIQSPSTHVNCVLCPNKYGAFKQTDKGLWAHVVCAIWIPEVHFANTVFLEPIIGFENIDRARWKLMCYICRKRNAGACIQCDKANCYTAFHVTCAQQAGLYMNIQEEVVDNDQYRRRKSDKKQKKKSNTSSSSISAEVRRCAYCDIHTPLEVLSPRTRKAIGSLSNNGTVDCEEALKRAQKMRMKKARKILAERRNAPPVICMPVIPKERIQDILDRVEFENKQKFFDKLMSYWLMKRYSRNGVPILRRLQHGPGLKKADQNKKQNDNLNAGKASSEMSEEEKKKMYEQLKEQLTYWKKLRQDLEKARLLMELIRKRERLKRECVRINHLSTFYEINPFNGIFLQRILDLLKEMDKNKIFFDPVDPVEVPQYYETIKQPMDFSTIQTKLNQMNYTTFNQFENDFNLIINNCLQFNQKNSFYYKAGFKLREQASTLLKQAKRMHDNLEFETQLDTNSKEEAINK